MKKLSFYLIASVLFVSCLSKQNEKTVSLETQEIKASKLPFFSLQKRQNQKKTRPFSPNRILSNINTPEGCPDIWGTHRCVVWTVDTEEKMIEDYEFWYELVVSPTQDLRGYMFTFQGTESTQHPRDNNAVARRAGATPDLQMLPLDSSWEQSSRGEYIPDSKLREVQDSYDGLLKYKAKCIDGNLIALTLVPDNNHSLKIIYASNTSTGDFSFHSFHPENKIYSEKLSMAWKHFAQQTDFPTSPQEGRRKNITQCFKL